MITRTTPTLGYIDPGSMSNLGVSHSVSANGLLFMAGVVPLQGTLPDAEVVFPNDVPKQLSFCLDLVDQCLVEAGSSREHLLHLTIYCTNMEPFMEVLNPIFSEWTGEHRPAMTGIGVDHLSFPGMTVEVQPIALVP